MADFQLDLNKISPAAKFAKLGADEPHYLLDELVARKLSSLLAGDGIVPSLPGSTRVGARVERPGGASTSPGSATYRPRTVFQKVPSGP